MTHPDLIAKYGGPVPRYTSYPTAPHFHGGIGPRTVREWMQASRGEASVYIHMAYCKQLCLYCGCNMKVTNNLNVVSSYVEVLMAEMRMVAEALPERLDVSTLHLGGGTPSYCPVSDLEQLMAVMRDIFMVRDGAEVSMEIDPRQLAEGMPEALGQLGFNRASLGIQDTNPEVQRAIKRVQPQEMNRRAVRLLRDAGVRNINVDLLYGLPLQTPETIRRTIDDVLELKPERIALFGYAHVPWMKKHQVVLENYGMLPCAAQRMVMFDTAAEALKQAGYLAVGLDHFCLPSDPMAQALQQDGLHRNFMGYTTDAAPLMLGFGASAISQYRDGYAQNVSSPTEYMALVKNHELPVVRGIRMTGQDHARRAVIEQLLCSQKATAPDLTDLLVDSVKLKDLIGDGLVKWQGDSLYVTEKGRPFVRVVASCFDAYVQPEGRYSKAV